MELQKNLYREVPECYLEHVLPQLKKVKKLYKFFKQKGDRSLEGLVYIFKSPQTFI